jgi:hypothetical protein
MPGHEEARRLINATLAEHALGCELGRVVDAAELIITALDTNGLLVPEGDASGDAELLELARACALRIRGGKRDWSNVEVLANCVEALTRQTVTFTFPHGTMVTVDVDGNVIPPPDPGPVDWHHRRPGG